MSQKDTVDPDVRFLLANERTILAWIRTALGLVAGGLVLVRFSNSNLEMTVGVVATALGAITSAVGYARYQHADKAIRENRLPDRGRGPVLLVAGTILFALVLVIIEVADWL